MGLAEPLCLLSGAASLLRGLPPAQICLLSSASLGITQGPPAAEPWGTAPGTWRCCAGGDGKNQCYGTWAALGPSWHLSPASMAASPHRYSECALSALKLQNHPRYSWQRKSVKNFPHGTFLPNPKWSKNPCHADCLDKNGWLHEHPISHWRWFQSTVSCHCRSEETCWFGDFLAAIPKLSMRSNILFLQECLP